MACNVCLDVLPAAVYESVRSLTSLCEIRQEPTRVRTCRNCAHVQTDGLADAAKYYDQDYEILTDSEEEDQIYEVRDGVNVYRTQHQLNVLLEQLDIAPASKILDFGCAKSSIMRSLISAMPDVEPYLFDVSDRYLPFWEKFVSQERCATYEIPDHWDSSFDVVTSFFSLEHVTHPLKIVSTIVRLLKPGGVLYGVVPNLFGNTADFIVIDHENHFTSSSLECLLRSAGMVPTNIDDSVHRGAWVFTAIRPNEDGGQSWQRDAGIVEDCLQSVGEIARFWTEAAGRLQVHEAAMADSAPLAIYGAGFYGSFIHASLEHPERVQCFLDQNPYLQGRSIHGAPVLPPEALPQGIANVLVGLNPGHAKRIIADIPALQQRDIGYFYL